jgi:hypothetical protein
LPAPLASSIAFACGWLFTSECAIAFKTSVSQISMMVGPALWFSDFDRRILARNSK